MARERTSVVGILPLVHMGNWLLGRALVSMPFLNYGGVCAENTEAEDLLVREAIDIAISNGINYLELRQQNKLNMDLATSEHKVTLSRALVPDSGDIFRGLPKKVRYKIRKAEEYGLKFGVYGLDKLAAFYEVFLEGQRNLGSPPFGKNFFERVFKEFPTEMRISLVEYNEKVLAGAITGCFKNTVEGLWACSLDEYHKFYPNEFMYWKHLEYASNQGFSYFNFGRSSKDSGSFRFKEKFGAQVQQLYWQYYLNKTATMPYANSRDWKYEIARRVWRRLPLPVCRALGPYIRKYVPQ